MSFRTAHRNPGAAIQIKASHLYGYGSKGTRLRFGILLPLTITNRRVRKQQREQGSAADWQNNSKYDRRADCKLRLRGALAMGFGPRRRLAILSVLTVMKRKPPRKQTPKQTAKMLAEVVREVAPIYAKHGKRIAGIVLPKP